MSEINDSTPITFGNARSVGGKLDKQTFWIRVLSNSQTKEVDWSQSSGQLDWSMENPDQIIYFRSDKTAENQQWYFIYDESDDTYQFMAGPLTVNGAITAAYPAADTSGTKVVARNSNADKWKLFNNIGETDFGSELLLFINASTGKSMEVPGGKLNTSLILNDLNGSMDQCFVLIPVS